MNVFATGLRNQPWLWQVTILCFVLGVLLAGSLQTLNYVNRSGLGNGRLGVPPRPPGATGSEVKLQKEIRDLQASKTELETAIAGGNSKLKTLNDELQRNKMLACLTAMRGPGVSVFMQDSTRRPPSDQLQAAVAYLIHDSDLQQVVNELKASGAEAISVSGQRVTARTAIRCVGPTIQVNGVPIAPPYEVHAIGEPTTLATGLNMRDGVLDLFRRVDPAMVRVEKRPDLVVPAYAGSTETRFAKPVEVDQHSEKEKSDR